MTDENPQADVPAEAATPTPEIVESAPTEPTDTTPDDSGQEPQEAKRVPWFQKRIDELTFRYRDTERERDYWREHALRAQPEPDKPKADEPRKAITLEDFQFDEAKYQAAVAEQAREIARAEAREAYRAEREAERAAERERTFAERVQKVAKDNPSLLAALRDPTLPVSSTMAEVIKDSDMGPELLGWIAENRDQAEQLYRLPAHLAARELGRIEARLEAAKAPVPKPAVSKAPPPPPKVDDVETPLASVKASDPESERLSDAEWTRLRNREVKRKKA